MTQDEKLDEALRGTFPASDAFWLEPQAAPPLPTGGRELERLAAVDRRLQQNSRAR
jgi:hypothetical protein